MRNRFTIDTDIVFDGEPDQDLTSSQELDSDPLPKEEKAEQLQPELTGDTDRWVEEQFHLEDYEEQEEMKETDILSDDDDEFCQTPRATSAEADLEASVMALSLESEDTEESESLMSPTVGGTDAVDDPQKAEGDEVWVRRDELTPPSD